MTLGCGRRATVYAYMCAHKQCTHSFLYFFSSYQSHGAGRSHLIRTSNLFSTADLCLVKTIVKQHDFFPLCAGPGLLESGSIAVPVILRGCYRCRNRKSIKVPMNQHCWPPLPGHCATLPAAPPLHCLSPSLNPISGAE